MRRISQWVMLLGLLLSGLSCASESSVPPPITSAPSMGGSGGGSEPTSVSGEKITVKLETTKGEVVIELYPDWAPLGVARVKELVELGFYNDIAFFRVVPGFVVQFGMSGDPALGAKWSENNINDEPVKESNRRGYVTFAKSGRPNSRSTQLFISLGNNASLDGQGFSPIGRVVSGLDIVEKINAEYGERPDQGEIKARGNEYLRSEFPKLDYIVKASIVTETKLASGETNSGSAKSDEAVTEQTDSKEQ